MTKVVDWHKGSLAGWGVSSYVFSPAEVQQLREVLKVQLNALEYEAESLKDDAKFWKGNMHQSLLNDLWKEHFKVKAKIKKLAALQTKMKSFDVLY